MIYHRITRYQTGMEFHVKTAPVFGQFAAAQAVSFSIAKLHFIIINSIPDIIIPVIIMMNSVWEENVQLPSFPRLEHDLKTDVLIIGGGLAGILCAWKLQQDSVNYALIEADTILNGVSRNTTAKLTSQHGLIYHKLLRRFGPEKARLYWQANEQALAQYRTLAQTMDCDFENKDNYIYTTDNVAVLEKEWQALRQLRIPAQRCSKLPLPFPVAGAISFPNQAQFHSLKFASKIAAGLNIFEHTAAKAFADKTVITDRGKIHAQKIIFATHFPILNKHGAYFLKQYQHRSYVLALKNAPTFEGMYLDDASTGLSFRNYGDLLLLGGGGHRTGKKGGCWEELETFAKQHLQDAEVVCRWATQDCMTLDDIPYIGQYSKSTPDLFVATGFNKWGMTTSMVSAMLLSDLVQGKSNPYTALFSPSRTMLRPQLIINGAETTFNLLTPTKPRCPHLGCALKWNSAERSWDCPCHGSRFAGDGTLLDNPATGDLK